MRVLHLGCGREPLPEWIPATEEVRADIDPDVRPDFCVSMTDLGDVGEYDCVYSSHSLEHIYPHEVTRALSEMRRVTKKGGVVIAIVPNLEGVEPTDEVVYQSDGGPITGHDMFYGHHELTATNPHMAHRTGFVRDTLAAALGRAGFERVRVDVHLKWNLLGVAVK